MRGVKDAERAAAQAAIDAVVAKHAAAVRRADDEHAAAVASLTEKRNADIAAVLDMADVASNSQGVVSLVSHIDAADALDIVLRVENATGVMGAGLSAVRAGIASL